MNGNIGTSRAIIFMMHRRETCIADAERSVERRSLSETVIEGKKSEIESCLRCARRDRSGTKVKTSVIE